MQETKAMLTSKGVTGGAGAAIVFAGQIISQLSSGAAIDPADLATNITGLIMALLAIYGRIKADKKVVLL